MMSVRDQLAQALCAEDPTTSLSNAVRLLVAQGQDRDSLYVELEKLRTLLEGSGREADEDVVLDVMDFLSGFCSPQVRI
jgi:hypothetical protein